MAGDDAVCPGCRLESIKPGGPRRRFGGAAGRDDHAHGLQGELQGICNIGGGPAQQW